MTFYGVCLVSIRCLHFYTSFCLAIYLHNEGQDVFTLFSISKQYFFTSSEVRRELYIRINSKALSIFIFFFFFFFFPLKIF